MMDWVWVDARAAMVRRLLPFLTVSGRKHATHQRHQTVHLGRALKSSDFGADFGGSPPDRPLPGLKMPPPTELIRLPPSIRSGASVMLENAQVRPPFRFRVAKGLRGVSRWLGARAQVVTVALRDAVREVEASQLEDSSAAAEPEAEFMRERQPLPPAGNTNLALPSLHLAPAGSAVVEVRFESQLPAGDAPAQRAAWVPSDEKQGRPRPDPAEAEPLALVGKVELVRRSPSKVRTELSSAGDEDPSLGLDRKGFAEEDPETQLIRERTKRVAAPESPMRVSLAPREPSPESPMRASLAPRELSPESPMRVSLAPREASNELQYEPFTPWNQRALAWSARRVLLGLAHAKIVLDRSKPAALTALARGIVHARRYAALASSAMRAGREALRARIAAAFRSRGSIQGTLALDTALRVRADEHAMPTTYLRRGAHVRLLESATVVPGWVLAVSEEGDVGFMPRGALDDSSAAS